MASLNEGPDASRAVYMKGAPEAILLRCSWQLTDGGEVPLDAESARSAAQELSARGLRVLAMAYRPTRAERLDDALLGDDFFLAGIQGMEDPVRPEAVAAVAAAHEAGIRVLMLTGDHLATAQERAISTGSVKRRRARSSLPSASTSKRRSTARA